MKRRWMNWIVKADFPTPAQNHSNKINGEYEGWCEPPPPTTTSLYCLKNWAYAQVKQCSDMKTWQADIPWQWEWQPYQRDEYILRTDINISSYPGPSRQLNQAICNLFPGSGITDFPRLDDRSKHLISSFSHPLLSSWSTTINFPYDHNLRIGTTTEARDVKASRTSGKLFFFFFIISLSELLLLYTDNTVRTP